MKENLKIVYLLFGVVLVLTAVALLWIPLLLHYGNQKVKVSPVAKTLTTSPVVSTNSDEAKILFFTNNIFPIVKHIRSEQWGIKALNTRHSELAGAILKRYGKPYNVEIGINYGKGETNMESMLALCYLQTDGSPAVRLYVPTAMWLFGNLSRSGNTNWQEQFVYAITIAYFHEMDHLSEGLLNTNMAVYATTEQKIAYETRAAALTCEHTIRRLLEFPGITLTEDDRQLYEAWVKSGRNEESPIWQNTVKKRWQLQKP